MESSFGALATYRPCWTDASGGLAAGPDEDVVTMAVAVARAVLNGDPVRHVALVSRQSIPAVGRAAIASALNLSETAVVETVAGGAVSLVDALLASEPGSLVIGVEVGPQPSAAAVITRGGTGVSAAGHAEHGLPAGGSGGRHDDPRFIRERAWRPLLEALDRDRKAVAITGIPPRAIRELADDRRLVESPDLDGAPAPLFAAAAMLAADVTGKLVALEGGSGAAFELRELGWPVTRLQRHETVQLPAPPSVAAEIAISLSAYERAFEAKVGLKAARCDCGELSLPPRSHCLKCGRQNATRLVAIPHAGEVYSVVTVRVPLPGLSVPYSIAIVSIDETPLRLLSPVTDARAGSVAIGRRGELVLRRLATREGIPDYGYAFQPTEAVAS
jgi:uncharacterized protein